MAYALMVLRDTLIMIGGIVLLYIITVVYTRRIQRRDDAENERIGRKRGLFDRKIRSRTVADRKVGRDGRQGR
jgi:hypothetical protein